MIDQDTASAAEIVTGALRDRQRARVFGQRSYGKGSVQRAIDLSDGSGLKLTVARYITPSGRIIEKHGVDPDEVVEKSDKGDLVLASAEKWVLAQMRRR